MFNKRLLLYLLSLIIIVNVLSYLAFSSPILEWLVFIFIILCVTVISWRNLYYGVLSLLLELMISSQGHLFDLDIKGFRLSMRMGIFLVLLIVGGIKFLISNFKFLNNFQFLISNFKRLIKTYKFYILFFILILWGIVNGLLHGNNLSFLYQDANGYFFFLLLPVFVFALQDKKALHYLVSVWASGIIWQFIIAITLLFLYGHLEFFWRPLVPLYDWFRDQRIIEVGLFKHNFYRVFMQSGLWTLTGFFIFLSLDIFKENKSKFWLKIILVFSITTLIISLSRSFWIAALCTFIIFIITIVLTIRPSYKWTLWRLFQGVILFGISIGIIAIILVFPIGNVPGIKSLAGLRERATEIEEAAIHSRWELLPALSKKISESWLLGYGFGATVRYRTSDPRYLSAHPENPYYETFAFEWGWLDIWYEMGIFGLLTYLIIIVSVIYKAWSFVRRYPTKYPLEYGAVFGLVALVIVQVFSPIFNHPLGIGYLLLTQAILQDKTKTTTQNVKL